MSAEMLMTQCMHLRRARRTNCTDTSFDTLASTTTEPALDADAGSATAVVVIDLLKDRGRRDGPVQNSVFFMPFGIGNDDTTFDVRVVGWRYAFSDYATHGLWVPVTLGGFSCTLSSQVGVANAAVIATERFADTITRITAQGNDVSSEIVSPANNTPGHVILDLKGCHKVEFCFDMTGATSGNVLYAFL